MEQDRYHVNVFEKIGYASGDVASCLYWQTISLYLLYFYTDVFGISAAAAGMMILVTRIWDGVNDPIMGIIADRTESKWGKFRPYIIGLAIPLAVIAVLTFSVPDFGSTGKLVYAYITFILFMMIYTALNIPYSSLLGVITPNPVERTSLSSYKYVGAYLGGLIVSAFLLPMTSFFGKGSETLGWTISMVIFGIVATILFIFTFFITRERVIPIRKERNPISRDLRDLASNKPWLLLLLTSLSMILFVSIKMNATTYYFKYYVGSQKVSALWLDGTYGFVKITSVFNTIGMIFSILGVFMINWLSKYFDKKNLFIYLFIMSAIISVCYYFLQPEQLFLMMVLQAIGSLVGGPLTPLIWAMYADTADYSEWKNGRRATGLVFSASTMSQKFGWAFGTVIAGFLLSTIGFKPHVEQSAEVVHGIRMLMSLIPAVAAVLSVIFIIKYNLNNKIMKVIVGELTEKRKNQVQ